MTKSTKVTAHKAGVIDIPTEACKGVQLGTVYTFIICTFWNCKQQNTDNVSKIHVLIISVNLHAISW